MALARILPDVCFRNVFPKATQRRITYLGRRYGLVAAEAGKAEQIEIQASLFELGEKQFPIGKKGGMVMLAPAEPGAPEGEVRKADHVVPATRA